MYTVNTIEDLLASLTKIKETQPDIYEEYTIKEIVEDGITMGEVNPELLKDIMWTMVEV